VKTRLAPLLGSAGAARLHARLVERTLATAVAARCGPVELHCAPGKGDPFLRGCASRYGARLRSQARGDLGARMHAALERALRERACAMIVGSDCPVLEPRDLREAAAALARGADAVLAPAEDGGYALIGLRRADRALFRGISWGGADVMAPTRRRLEALRWRAVELRTVWDVDRPRDHVRLARAGLI
jgi:hypothetical protein